MTVQLIGKDDSNFDDFDMFTGRWQAYIDSFITVRHQHLAFRREINDVSKDEDTRGSPIGKTKPPFLPR